MKRRQFLKHLLATQTAAATFLYGNPLLPRLKLANAASNKTLVVLFQRGGCDGLNTVVPYGDDDYYRLRPGLALAGSSVIKLNNMFGLHPNLAPLQSIYNSGDMAIMPAVHYSNASRSHFSGQTLVESGGPANVNSGWMNRYLTSTNPTTEIPAISMGSSLAHALRGDFPLGAVHSLGNMPLSGADELDMRARLRAVYGQQVSSSDYNRGRLNTAGNVSLDLLDTLDALDVSSYSPANGASYPSGSLGNQLQDIAQLIKKGVGLEMATVDHGNYDTHAEQGRLYGHQPALLSEMAEALQAFYTDMGTQMNDVVVLVMTEFGRTAKENASSGTDHGNASAWFAIGKSVNGGIHGSWPGLSDADLYQGRYLAQSLDMRDVMAEILSRHLGQYSSIASALPGHSYSPIGFL